MKQYISVFLFVFSFALQGFSQGDNCCQKVMAKGKTLFEICEYEEAIKKFEGARDGCTTCPEVQQWIAKTEACRSNPNASGCPSCKEDVPPPNDFCPMVYVQGGTFTMGCTSEQGSDCYDWEKPSHSVTLGNYWIGKYEVTQAEWRSIMGSNPSYFKDCDNCPVEQVSWGDIQRFLRTLNQKYPGRNYRLPTEAEWEYAARGGNKKDGTKYAGSSSMDNAGWYTANSGSKTHPVGQKSANGLGIYDMSGNVWEWCSEWYGSYSSGSQTNPTGATSGSDRVYRGGSWRYGARFCRASSRFYYSQTYRDSHLGFRLSSTE